MKKNIKTLIGFCVVALWLTGACHRESQEQKRLNDWVVYCQYNGIEPTETPTAQDVNEFNKYYINK